jgi:hypothetical protein
MKHILNKNKIRINYLVIILINNLLIKFNKVIF